MADLFEEVWASDSDAVVTPPTIEQIRRGFVCGAAPLGIFNWLFQTFMSTINELGIGDMASKFRRIDTTEGITGGGDLTGDRTLRLDINGLQEEATIAAGDYIALYDVSTSATRKMTRANFLSGIAGGGGAITGGANVGTGAGEVFAGVSGNDLQLRKIKAGDGINITVASNDIVVSLADMGSELTIV